MTDITADALQKFIGKLSRRGLSPKTIRNCFAPISKLMRHAVQWGYLKASPMPDVDLPTTQKKEMAFLPPDEIRQFLAQVPEKWHPFFVTAALSGMRMSELLAMKWSNLDLEGQQYHN